MPIFKELSFEATYQSSLKLWLINPWRNVSFLQLHGFSIPL